MENIETKDVERKDTERKDTEIVEAKSTDVVQDILFTKITVNELTQGKDLSTVLHKILTLCFLSKTVDAKVITWVKLVEAITKQEFEELTKIQKNFDYQIVNRDFRNDEKLKGEFAKQESAKMTRKITSLVDVPMIDKALIQSQINLNEAEFKQLEPFFFPVTDIDIVAVFKE
jgi:hypothetical protein